MKETNTVFPIPTHPKYTSIGSYPILYLTSKDDCLCADCATEEAALEDGEKTTGHVNWESLIYCAECSVEIESAYGEYEPADSISY